MDFSNLDFEAINTNVLVDEAKEQEEATAVVVKGDGATEGGPTDETHVDEGHVDEVVVAPWKKTFNIFLLLFFFLFFFFWKLWLPYILGL